MNETHQLEDGLLGLLEELVDFSRGFRIGHYTGCIEAAKAALHVEAALRELCEGRNPDAEDLGCDRCSRKASYTTTVRDDEACVCVVCAAELRAEYGMM